MKKKCLIVVANYYENISNNLLQSTLRFIKNKLSFNSDELGISTEYYVARNE